VRHVTRTLFVGVTALVVLLSLTGCVVVRVAPTATLRPTSTRGAIVDCTGRGMTLNQPNTVYRLSGNCGDLTVQGQGIVITMDSARSLTISGDRATVTADTLGLLSISGQDSSVTADTVGALTIRGDRNTVRSDSIGPSSIAGHGDVVGGK
jgi:hypothetical protein